MNNTSLRKMKKLAQKQSTVVGRKTFGRSKANVRKLSALAARFKQSRRIPKPELFEVRAR